MSVYRSQANKSRAIREITPEDRLSNQVVISGTNQSISVAQGALFIEVLQVDSGGTVEIKDGSGKTISTSISNFEQDHSPLRCDLGATITGDVDFAKGFIIEDLFA